MNIKKSRPYPIKLLLGSLFVLLYMVWIYFSQMQPPNNLPLELYYGEWLRILASGVVAYLIGSGIGFLLQLQDLNSINYFSFDNNSTDFFSEYPMDDNLAVKTPENTMSINPASGLPMSGSSRMDSSGNPYGSNSW
jgi:hypothetical protein